MRVRNSEVIEMLATSHGYFPASFRWRGRRFDVVAVEKCWTATGLAPCRMFQVRCAPGVFIVEQSLPAKRIPGAIASPAWRVQRWPATLWLVATKRPRSPRYPLPRGQRRPQARPHMLAQLVERLPGLGDRLARSNRPWTPTPQQP